MKNTVTINSFYEVYTPLKKIVALRLIFCMPLRYNTPLHTINMC